MIRVLDRCGIVLALAVSGLWPVNALADAQNKAAAESLYRDALAMMEKGEYPPACPKLAESQRLDPAVGTLLYLGECYEKLGLTASAWVTFTAAIDAAKRVNNPDRQRIATERAAQLASSISHLTIAVPPHVRVPRLEVKRDGVLVGEASWGVAVPVDPGDHTLEAAAPGRQSWVKKVRIEAGTRAELTEDLPALAENSPTVAPGSEQNPMVITTQTPPPSEPGTSSKSGNLRRIAGLALGGVGIVGIAVGTIWGLKAKSKEKDSEAFCWPNDKSRCSHPGVELIDQAGDAATVANVGFVGGALAIAGGAVLYFTAAKATPATAISHAPTLRLLPELSPTRNSLILQGRF